MIKRFTKYLLLSGVLLGGFSLKSHAQIIQADAKLDRAAIKIGEQTQMHLIVRFHAKDKIGFPVLKDTISGKILIVNSKADTTVDKQGADITTIRHNYTITSFDSGEYVIPSYAFHAASGDVTTPPLALQVATVKVDTTKGVYDIKQPLIVKYTLWDWLLENWRTVLIVELIAILIGVGIAYYFIRKSKRGVEVVEPPKPVLPAHTIALEKLAELRDKKLWQQQQIKQYHIELSDTIREYLESRYNIKAHEQTSDEIFASLRHMDITEENRNTLRQTLILADLVKFAKEKPLPYENEQSMDNAVAFVNKTQQVIQVPVIKEEDKK